MLKRTTTFEEASGRSSPIGLRAPEQWLQASLKTGFVPRQCSRTRITLQRALFQDGWSSMRRECFQLRKVQRRNEFSGVWLPCVQDGVPKHSELEPDPVVPSTDGPTAGKGGISSLDPLPLARRHAEKRLNEGPILASNRSSSSLAARGETS
jgi:hypothetical protein